MKRIDRRTALALVLAAVLGSVAAYTAAQSGARGPEHTYALDDVRPGGYAALGELLRREGVRVETWERRTPELDAGVDVLVSAPAAHAPLVPAVRGAAEDDALVAWVRRGGHLVLAAPYAPAVYDVPHRYAAATTAARTNGTAARAIALTAGWRYRFAARLHDRVVLADARGRLAVTYDVGRGRIVALADAEPLANAHLGEAENARLIALVAGLPPRGIVTFDEAVHGNVRDRPWWSALGIPLRVTVGLAALALVAGLIGGMVRLGPPLPPPAAAEPTSAAFIEAVAAMHRRARSRAFTIETLAVDALRRAARAAGLDERLAATPLVERLRGHRFGATAAALAGTMHGPRDDANLIAAAHAAWRLRAEVDGDDGG